MDDGRIEDPTPKQRQRRRVILDAARDLFVANGYDHTSLDMIIARTGGSRRNIYDLFGNKDGLFEAVMRDQLEAVLARTHVPDALGDDRPVREQLIALGTEFLGGLLRPSVLQTLRQFIVAAGERPELGEQAYRVGPAVLYDRLESYFGAMAARGELNLPHVPTAARAFTEMLKAGIELRAIMTGDYDVPPDHVATHVERAVDLFLDGARPR
jgi:AcrR family transcriptional regulator